MSTSKRNMEALDSL